MDGLALEPILLIRFGRNLRVKTYEGKIHKYLRVKRKKGQIDQYSVSFFSSKKSYHHIPWRYSISSMAQVETIPLPTLVDHIARAILHMFKCFLVPFEASIVSLADEKTENVSIMYSM
jgi:hypothetical protein